MTTLLKAGDKFRFLRDNTDGGASFGRKGEEFTTLYAYKAPGRVLFKHPRHSFTVGAQYKDIIKVEQAPYPVGTRVKLVAGDGVTLRTIKNGEVGTVVDLILDGTSGVKVQFDGRSGSHPIYNAEIIKYVPAPAKPVRTFNEGDWVILDVTHPYNSAARTTLLRGKKYQVRKTSPSGKTIYLEGVAGSRSADRFVKVSAPITTPVGKAFYPYASTLRPVSPGITGHRADLIIADDVVATPKKTPKSVSVPHEEVRKAVARLLKDDYGIDAVVTGITSTGLGYTVDLK